LIQRCKVKGALINSENLLCCHSRAGGNPVKTIVYWMLVFTSMTAKELNQSFPGIILSLTCY
ncbi:MAG: hypothetical protein MI673_10125, partial [Thiotrichales bacterium]|nr:hypothetical protein [Thiotrichales bacterium]